jgi:S-adenosylmethionine hydrolase
VIKIAGLKIMGISNTYSDVKKGELLALVGSSDFLEIAVNSGRPCDMIGITQEDIIGIEVKVVEP